ncbi:MAG: hypothetical protein KDD19_15765, partial [Phaeodactylibacter sp.]|nr:hypothetical protein [Phaeodactylibacter sp.]
SAFGEFVGDNPTSAARIVYYLKKRHTFGKMEMEILDPSGKKVASLVPGKSKGINEVLWNYSYKMPKIATAKTFTFGGFTTPTVPPGTYTVRLTKGKEVYEAALELVPDPESIHSQADRDAQHDSAMKLYNMNESLAYLIDQVDMMMEGASTAKGKNPSKKVMKLLDPFATELQSMKEELVITTGDNYVGSAEPRLREKIASLYGAVAGYAGRPSNAQIQNLKLLSSQLETAQAKMDGITERLSKLNAALVKEGLPEISYRSKEEFMEADI